MRIGNYPLLWEVLEHVIRYPELYNQGHWRELGQCGTIRCIAGWAAYLGGYSDVTCNLPDISHREPLVLSPEQVVMEVEDAALTALDVDDSNGMRAIVAESLFSGYLTFDDVLGAVRDFARADGVVPSRKVAGEMHDRGVISDEEYAAWI